jgi:hypothetical protein
MLAVSAALKVPTIQLCGFLATWLRPYKRPAAVVGGGALGPSPSRTTSQMATARAMPKTAEALRVSRQPKTATTAAIGACPATAPAMPIIPASPLIRAKRRGGNQVPASFMVATKAKPAPPPIRSRPR